ncbi:MAG: MFS transporter [Actinomycetales bacterium]|nr:MFS transporter [Actinomycetales bacterium]
MDLRRARAAVTVAYVGQGLCFAALVSRVPAVQNKFELSDGALGLIVGLVPIIAGVGSVVAGSLAAKHGSRPVLRVMGPVVPLALVATGWAPSVALLLVALVALGFGLGSVDATMNIQGVRVQDDLGRAVVASFYAAFSLAGFVGALLASAAAGSTMSLGLFFALIAIVLIPVQLAAGRFLLPGHPVPTAVQVAAGSLPRIHWRPVMLVGIALMCVYIADSGASTFGADYLHKGLGSTESVAALAYAAYSLMTVAGRIMVDRTVERVGAVRLVRIGGFTAVAAVGAVAIAPSPALAIAAFAVLGLAICPAIPLAFTAAASHDKTSSGVAVARVNVFNYVGFVVGAPLIGGIAEGASLRWAFAALVPVLLVVPLLASWFRIAPHEAPDLVPGDALPT